MNTLRYFDLGCRSGKPLLLSTVFLYELGLEGNTWLSVSQMSLSFFVLLFFFLFRILVRFFTNTYSPKSHFFYLAQAKTKEKRKSEKNRSEIEEKQEIGEKEKKEEDRKKRKGRGKEREKKKKKKNETNTRQRTGQGSHWTQLNGQTEAFPIH